jgi:UrcA family protein
MNTETDMNANAPVLNTKSFICIAAVAACAVLSGPVQGKDQVVTVKISVSTAGLNLGQPADAREAYRRLQKVALTLCGGANRVGLEPLPDFAGCYEKALGGAVGSVNRPQLTMAYLRTHSLLDAATHGIDVPPVVTAK